MKSKSFRAGCFLASSISLMFCLASGVVVAQTPERIDVGACVSWPPYSVFELAEDQGMAPEYDINVSIYEDPLGGHAALATGQIDVFLCTPEYVSYIKARELGTSLVTYTDMSYGTDHIVLSPGVDADDVRGGRVAAPEGFVGEILMGVWLDSVGISPDEVTWVNLNADEAVGPMMAGDLAAAYMYEPWVQRVLNNLEGSSVVGTSADEQFLGTGMIGDVIFMNDRFIEERREAAKDLLRVRFEAAEWWSKNTAEANEQFAEYLGWAVEDVESIMGTNGKYHKGGMYVLDFDEAASLCGYRERANPFDLPQLSEIAQSLNEWWYRLGRIDEVYDEQAVDCSLIGDLVDDGFSQSFGRDQG